MCGIAGFTQLSGSVDNVVIRRMTGTLAHRGPDQQGMFASTRTSAHAALGAVRLQVIDLSGGEQPFLSEDRGTVIVYNGEIYNHAELRRELESLGHRFRSECDTEVALRAFIQWDTDCFHRFRGMYSMAIWSDARERLVLARDRMGIKPLYLTRIGNDLIFGSEMKALFAHPFFGHSNATRRLDKIALQDFLSLNYVPSPRTMVEGITKLPAGHYLEWRRGREEVVPYWQLRFQPDASIRGEEASEQLDHLLRAAVKENLTSDVPLGIWASGGIDSTTLIHYAAELQSRPLKTFSIAFESKSCDESPWFRDVARRYGTEHHEFELNRDSAITDAIEEFSHYSDEPGADAGALPVWFLSKMTREHVTVALSGEGGDELFGGYLTYKADMLARPLRMVPRILRQAALGTAKRLLPVSDAKIGFEYKLKRWLEGSLLDPDEAHLFWNGACTLEQKRALLPSSNGHHLQALFNKLPGADEIGFLNRYLMLDQLFYLQDNLLCKVDRMSMAHSLEVRPPLLDHRIVEFAARLPENLKINGLRQKVILKRTMRGKLPDAILDRRKAGLDIPAHEWFRGPLLPLLRDTLSAKAVRNSQLFDPGATESLINAHINRKTNAGYQLWGLLTLFLWLKKWNIEIEPPQTRSGHQAQAYAAAS